MLKSRSLVKWGLIAPKGSNLFPKFIIQAERISIYTQTYKPYI